MTSKRWTIAAATSAVALGTLEFGSSTALAAGNGVGPSAGTTGKTRACQVHAANDGKSVGKGLNCTPASEPLERVRNPPQ